MDLTGVPAHFHGRFSGTRADLRFEGLDELPEWLTTVTELNELSIGPNISELPEWIGELSSLEVLNLGDNQISQLPDSIFSLTKLRALYLHGNLIRQLPASVGNLINLKLLDLSQNEITHLPSTIGNLRNLAILDLSSNHIVELPPNIAALLTDTFDFSVSENPLREPFLGLAERGNIELATYLRSLDDAIELYEAKLLLVGEGNVGKSSLVAALKAKISWRGGRQHMVSRYPLSHSATRGSTISG